MTFYPQFAVAYAASFTSFQPKPCTGNEVLNRLRRVMSLAGPRRQLARCNEMSEVEVKADSKSTAQFGQK